MAETLTKAGPAATTIVVGRRPPGVARALRELRPDVELPGGTVAAAAERAFTLAREWESGAARVRDLLAQARTARSADVDRAAAVLLEGGKRPKPTAGKLYDEAEGLAQELDVIARATEVAVREFDQVLAADDGATLQAVLSARADAITEAAELVQRAGAAVGRAAAWNPAIRALGGSAPRRLEDLTREVVALAARVGEYADTSPPVFKIGDLTSASTRSAQAS